MQFRSKPLAVLSMILVLAGTLGGWHAPDDRDEYAAAVVHQHADHDARFTTPAAAAPEHCVFCHWVRALGHGAPTATQLLASDRVQFNPAAEGNGFARTKSRLALPSRAPPLA